MADLIHIFPGLIARFWWIFALIIIAIIGFNDAIALIIGDISPCKHSLKCESCHIMTCKKHPINNF